MKHLPLLVVLTSFVLLSGCGPKEDEDFFSDEKGTQEQMAKEITPQEKIDQFKQILEIDPDDYQIRNNLGVEYAKLKLLDEAIAEFKKVLEKKPDYNTAWLNLGSAYGDMGNIDEAIKCYQKAVELNPTYAKAYMNLGVAYFQQKKYKEAIEKYNKFIELNNGKGDENTYNTIAECYKALKDKDNTMKYYKKILEVNPNNEWVKSQLANIDSVFSPKENEGEKSNE